MRVPMWVPLVGAIRGLTMKSKVIQLDPELRQAAEAVLRKDESLSAFVETSLRENITHRQVQKEFLARGIAGRDEARRTGKYFDTPTDTRARWCSQVLIVVQSNSETDTRIRAIVNFA